MTIILSIVTLGIIGLLIPMGIEEFKPIKKY